MVSASAVQSCAGNAARYRSSTCRRRSASDVTWQPQHPLGDDVALDLAGAAGDGEAAAAEEAADPGLARAGGQVRPVAGQQVHPELEHPLLVLRAEQLGDRSL